MNLTKIVPNKNYHYKAPGCENDKVNLVQRRICWENHTLLMPSELKGHRKLQSDKIGQHNFSWNMVAQKLNKEQSRTANHICFSHMQEKKTKNILSTFCQSFSPGSEYCDNLLVNKVHIFWVKF